MLKKRDTVTHTRKAYEDKILLVCKKVFDWLLDKKKEEKTPVKVVGGVFNYNKYVTKLNMKFRVAENNRTSITTLSRSINQIYY